MRSNGTDVRPIRLRLRHQPPRLRLCSSLLESRCLGLGDGSVVRPITLSRCARRPIANSATRLALSGLWTRRCRAFHRGEAAHSERDCRAVGAPPVLFDTIVRVICPPPTVIARERHEQLRTVVAGRRARFGIEGHRCHHRRRGAVVFRRRPCAWGEYRHRRIRSLHHPNTCNSGGTESRDRGAHLYRVIPFCPVVVPRGIQFQRVNANRNHKPSSSK